MRRVFFAVMVAVMIGTVGVASASVQFDLDAGFSPAGTNRPTGMDPSGVGTTLVDVKIYDYNDPLISAYSLTQNDALVVISAHLAPLTHVSDVALNFTQTVSQLTFTYLGSVGGVTPVVPEDSINKLANGIGIDTIGGFDINIGFQGEDFDGNDIVVFKASYTSPLLSGYFNDVNTIGNNTGSPPYPNGGIFHAAARIDADAPAKMGYVGDRGVDTPTDAPPVVPEPATLAIWSLGLGIAGLVRLRRKK